VRRSFCLLGMLLLAAIPSAAWAQALPIASWLDDADTLHPGQGTIGLSFERWESPGGGETDLPVFDVAAGVARGVQLGATVPFSRAHFADGFRSSGLGDTYLNAKFRLMNGEDNLVGLAFSPLLEILSAAELHNAAAPLKRVNWAVPLMVEVSGDFVRAYATGGYFSRGAVFVSGAVEVTLSKTVTVAGELSVSHSTKLPAGVDLTGLYRSRADALGSLFVQVSKTVTLSASVGRTVSRTDVNGATLIANGGITVAVGTP